MSNNSSISQPNEVQSPGPSARGASAVFARLYRNSESSDVSLRIGNERIPAHSRVLRSHSKTFERILIGKVFDVSHPIDVIITEPKHHFMPLLDFMYKEECDVKILCVGDLVEVLRLAGRYEIEEVYVNILDELYPRISKINVAVVLNFVVETEHSFLLLKCLKLIKQMITDKEMVSLQLTLTALSKVVDYCVKTVPHDLLFEAIARCSSLYKQQDKLKLFLLLDFRQIPASHLLELIDDQTLLQIKPLSVPYEVGDLLIGAKARVLQGNDRGHLFTSEEEYTWHGVGGHIEVDLGKTYIVNSICFNLGKSSCYYIEVARIKNEWIKVIDYSNTFCRKLQEVYFPEIIIRYIRIYGVGTLHENQIYPRFECNELSVHYYSVEVPSKSYDGYVVPNSNVASDSLAITKTTNFNEPSFDCWTFNRMNKENGLNTLYTSQLMHHGGFEVIFNQPYYLNSCRFFLWNYDGRTYNYRVDTSLDGEKFEFAYENDEPAGGLQEILFTWRPVSVLSIQGLSCSVKDKDGEELRIVYFDAPILEDS